MQHPVHTPRSAAQAAFSNNDSDDLHYQPQPPSLWAPAPYDDEAAGNDDAQADEFGSQQELHQQQQSGRGFSNVAPMTPLRRKPPASTGVNWDRVARGE